jgi:hypothetical protein
MFQVIDSYRVLYEASIFFGRADANTAVQQAYRE